MSNIVNESRSKWFHSCSEFESGGTELMHAPKYFGVMNALLYICDDARSLYTVLHVTVHELNRLGKKPPGT